MLSMLTQQAVGQEGIYFEGCTMRCSHEHNFAHTFEYNVPHRGTLLCVVARSDQETACTAAHLTDRFTSIMPF